jgi:MOSC domain-containing protein
VATVARLSITPVKSTRLHHPDQIALERFGVPGNRNFYFVNAEGRLLGGARTGGLVAIRAEYDPRAEHLEFRFPDETSVWGSALGDGEHLTTDFWGRPVPGRVVDGPWTAAVSAFIGEPVRLVRPDRPGDGNDSHPASLVGVASVRELGRQAGVLSLPDPRRFRMLIEIDGTGPHEEDSWLGRTVAMGDAVVRVVRPDSRCTFTERDPDTGQIDFRTLRTIRAYRGRAEGGGLNFGVYADVVVPGSIRVGDAVVPDGSGG